MDWEKLGSIIKVVTKDYIDAHGVEAYNEHVKDAIGEKLFDEYVANVKKYGRPLGDGGKAPDCVYCSVFCHVLGIGQSCYPCVS